jgi:hypothetical protein
MFVGLIYFVLALFLAYYGYKMYRVIASSKPQVNETNFISRCTFIFQVPTHSLTQTRVFIQIEFDTWLDGIFWLTSLCVCLFSWGLYFYNDVDEQKSYSSQLLLFSFSFLGQFVILLLHFMSESLTLTILTYNIHMHKSYCLLIRYSTTQLHPILFIHSFIHSFTQFVVSCVCVGWSLASNIDLCVAFYLGNSPDNTCYFILLACILYLFACSFWKKLCFVRGNENELNQESNQNFSLTWTIRFQKLQQLFHKHVLTFIRIKWSLPLRVMYSQKRVRVPFWQQSASTLHLFRRQQMTTQELSLSLYLPDY